MKPINGHLMSLTSKERWRRTHQNVT